MLKHDHHHLPPSLPTPTLALRVQFAFVVKFFLSFSLSIQFAPCVRFHRCRHCRRCCFTETWQNMLGKDFHFLQCHSENGIRMKIFCISGVLILDKIYKLLYAKVFIPMPRHFWRRNPLFPSHCVRCRLTKREMGPSILNSGIYLHLQAFADALASPLGAGNGKREKISLFMQLWS